MNNRKCFLRLFLCLSFGWGVLALNAQTVSKSFNDTPLKTVLKEVESQTGLSVVYKTDEVDVNRKVNASFQNSSLDEVMSKILGPQLTWIVQDKMIIISKKQVKETSKSDKSLTVSGVVTDETGIPVIGASVLVRGSSNGSITDMDGNFSIADVPQDAMIDISYIGYKTLTFKATDKALANVVLKEDTEVLEEVVVVGYGTAKKANLSGSVAQISSKEIEHRISANTGSALQGLIPNFNVSFSDGAINKKASFNVRGEGSINGGCHLRSTRRIWCGIGYDQESREREDTGELLQSFRMEQSDH